MEIYIVQFTTIQKLNYNKNIYYGKYFNYYLEFLLYVQKFLLAYNLIITEDKTMHKREGSG